MEIEVFFGDKKIKLIQDTSIQERISFDGDEIFNFLSGGKKKELEIFSKNIDEFFFEMTNVFKYIEAAGGVVFDRNKENILLIQRFGMCDLPKGKIEKNESPGEAAIREVSEECGINSLQIIKEIAPTYHIYIQKESYYLKKTFWFEMEHLENEELQAQIEEHITKVYWHPVFDIKQCISKTYNNLIKIFVMY